MVIAFIAALVIAAGTAFWLKQSRPASPRAHVAPQAKAAPPGKASQSKTSKSGGRFAAVEIRTRSGACHRAQALEGRRFLAKDAPTLPLPDCKAAECSCAFSKLSDRRTEGRRLDFGGLSASQFLDRNRRKNRDRRRAAQARR